MGSLILAILFGVIFAYFALQNAATTFVSFGNYIFALPLYLIALGSLLAGAVIAGLLNLTSWAQASMTLSTKDKQLRKTQELIADLKNRIRELELENVALRGESREVKNIAAIETQQAAAHTQAPQENHPPIHQNSLSAFLDRLRYRLAV